MLRPGIAGMRGSMVIRLTAMHDVECPSPPPLPAVEFDRFVRGEAQLRTRGLIVSRSVYLVYGKASSRQLHKVNPLLSLEVATPQNNQFIDAVIHMQENPPLKRFLVRCSSPFMRPGGLLQWKSTLYFLELLTQGAPFLYSNTGISKKSNCIPMNNPMTQVYQKVIIGNIVDILTVLS